MTATSTATPKRKVSRNCTSGPSTSCRTPNVWRASKLGAKTRPTTWSNIFRWYRAGWGRYTQSDPIGLNGGWHVYAYAGRNPIVFVDLIGLVSTRSEIVEHRYDTVKDWLVPCGALQAAGECGSIGAYVECNCVGDGGCWQAEATLVQTGDIHLYTGNFRDLPQAPADPSITNADRARRHAYDRHVTPATNAARRVLSRLEQEVFTNEHVCMDWCYAYTDKALKAFSDELKQTQTWERRGRRR
jgi:RHS repeat-associated protein